VHGSRDEHNVIHPECGISGFARCWWPRLFQPYDCDTHRRGRNDTADVYAPAANGDRERVEDYLNMFLARVEGTVVATVKHATLSGCRFLLARRMDADGSLAEEPNVVVDWHGAAIGSTVMISTDGDIARERFGNTTPARMVVAGIVDAMQGRTIADEVSA
jgi:ethanolamine utilization protein EutN